jgi:CheY-like chemotaxis protein
MTNWSATLPFTPLNMVSIAKSPPIVAGDASLEETARQLGADAFIFKPFGAEDLFAVINQFVLAPPTQPAKKVTQLKETSHGNDTDDA